MTTTSANPILTLVGLFLSLKLDGVTAHDYVDYLFVKYHIAKLPDLTPEMVSEQELNLSNMLDKKKIKADFRKYLLEIQAKLKKFGWGAFNKEVF